MKTPNNLHGMILGTFLVAIATARDVSPEYQFVHFEGKYVKSSNMNSGFQWNDYPTPTDAWDQCLRSSACMAIDCCVKTSDDGSPLNCTGYTPDLPSGHCVLQNQCLGFGTDDDPADGYIDSGVNFELYVKSRVSILSTVGLLVLPFTVQEPCIAYTQEACRIEALRQGLKIGTVEGCVNEFNDDNYEGCYSYGDCAHWGGTSEISTNYASDLDGDYHRINTCQKETPETPTSDTTSDAEAGVEGDPHVKNMRAEAFDLMAVGEHTFLEIPRGADNPELVLVCRIARLSQNICESIFMEQAQLYGSWLGNISRVSFSAGSLAQKIPFHVTISAPDSLDLAISHKELLDSRKPLNISLNSGAVIEASKSGSFLLKFDHLQIAVQHVEHRHFGYLNIEVKGLSQLQTEVGGLLGLDSHTAETVVPAACTHKKTRPLMLSSMKAL